MSGRAGPTNGVCPALVVPGHGDDVPGAVPKMGAAGLRVGLLGPGAYRCPSALVLVCEDS